MRPRRVRPIFALLAVAFFATPLVLLAAGVRAREFENRPLERAPRLSDGWNGFQIAARYLTDHMPLREDAVHANSWISLHVLDTTPRYGPSERISRDPVMRGADDWLYLQEEIDNACRPFPAVGDALARWQQLVAIVRRSGRRAIALIPPDKSVIYPEHLPADFELRACWESGTRDLWDRLEPPSGGVVGLRTAVLAAKAHERDPIYKRLDSHWNELAALTLVRAALSAVGGSVRVRPSEVRDPGPAVYTGDLTTLIGAPESDTSPRRTIARPPGARQVPGTTVLVADSYGYDQEPLLRPYFARLEIVHWLGITPEQLAAAIARADTVIFEAVQRTFAYRTADVGSVNPRLFSLLGRYLASRR
jgi:hypothetical protein